MANYTPSKDDERSVEDKKAERKKMMEEFLARGGKVQVIPYGVTNMEMGKGNSNNFYDPPATITPKTWKARKTREKNKKAKK